MSQLLNKKLELISPAEICQNVVETIGKILDADIAILFSDSDLTSSKQYFTYQKSQENGLSLEHQLLELTILPTEKILIQNDIPHDPQLAIAIKKANISSTLSLPLDERLGFKACLTLHRCSPLALWRSQDINLASMMVSQAELLISQSQAYQRMYLLAQREATLNKITTAIRSSLEPQEMFDAIVKELGKALEVDACTLSLWTSESRFVECVAIYNPKEERKIRDETKRWKRSTISTVKISDNPLLQKLLATKKTVYSKDLEREQNLARYDLPWRTKSRALIIVPLIFDEEIMGSITIRESQLGRDWKSSEIELAEVVATQAAIAVKQAKLYETTRRQAQQLALSEKRVKKLNNYLTESILKRFLPEAIVNKAAKGKLALDLNPEPRQVTILFCDLVKFTELSDRLDTCVLSTLLNEYLEGMTRAVFELRGTVDKFIGDAVMALFGAPEELPPVEQARKAIATARLMNHYLKEINAKWQKKGIINNSVIPSLKLRCGIHQGTAVVGMFGGKQRKDYTAIGQVVNIAARLQTAAEPNSIFVSQKVFESLEPDRTKGIEPKLVKLKGIVGDFTCYSLPVTREH